jgi:hypothetical protein
MRNLPSEVQNIVTSRLSKRNLGRLAVASQSMRAATQRARTRRSRQKTLLKAVTQIARLRSRHRQRSPRTNIMVQVSRIMARLPKTHRTPQGEIYHPRQRLHNFLFQGGRLKPGVRRQGFLSAIQFGNIPNGAQWFYHNQIGGGQFRNGQWTTVIYPGFKEPFIVKEYTP